MLKALCTTGKLGCHGFVLCLAGHLLFSLHICERLSVMHKQVCVHIPQTVNFCPNSPESPFLESLFSPLWKVNRKIFKQFIVSVTAIQTRKKTRMHSSRMHTPPPQMKNFRFEMTKVYSGIPPQMSTPPRTTPLDTSLTFIPPISTIWQLLARSLLSLGKYGQQYFKYVC